MSPHPLGGNVELYKDDRDEWRWRRRAGNGQVIASGESYKNRVDALDIIQREYEGIPILEVDAVLKPPFRPCG